MIEISLNANPHLPASINNYLSKQKESIHTLKLIKDLNYNMAVVIPAIEEFENSLSLLQSLAENKFSKSIHAALIFVVNNLESSDKRIKEDNFKFLHYLNELIENNFTDTLQKQIADKYIIGFIDATSTGLELKNKDGGVGLARKIGMDLSLIKFDYSKPIQTIVCLDADCLVSANYIQNIYDEFIKRKVNAASIRFEHPLNEHDPNLYAIICYEIFLRYYVLGLKYAESPYAFFTVGSSMVCSAEAYCRIGGMNKRKAGEDFYFLEKLSKEYEIVEINSAIVYPSSRPSFRVPFGTGQRVNRFLSKSQNEYLLYNPHSFEILKEWLKVFKENLSTKEFLLAAKKINHSLYEFLEQQNFSQAIERILSNSKSEIQVQIQKQRWFDGFKTLKLTHYLRDNGLPQINMFDAVDIMFEKLNQTGIHRMEDIPNLETQIKYLGVLRNLTQQLNG